MTRKKKQARARPAQPEQEAAPASPAERPPKYAWLPLWVWALVFLLPLLASEFMFYMVGRVPSMIAFPLLWVGFWVAVMQRSGWVILKRGKGN